MKIINSDALVINYDGDIAQRTDLAVYDVKTGRWLSVDGVLKANHGKGLKPLVSGR